MLPCILHEDDDLLVVNKPPAWNTHAPSPYAGEGIYDWLRHREPRWATLSILHRLDKETSGVLVFGKTTRANQVLAREFLDRQVEKRYRLRTAARPSWRETEVRLALVRAGPRYVARPSHAGTPEAITRFRVVDHQEHSTEIEAVPQTGRTHQIRVHAAACGVPILGDQQYGGAPFGRVCLHATSLAFQHPGTGQRVRFEAPVEFDVPVAAALRCAFVDPVETDTYRLLHGAADGVPGVYLDRWNGFFVCQGTGDGGPELDGLPAVVPATASAVLESAGSSGSAPGIYLQPWERQLAGRVPAQLAPMWRRGPEAPEAFLVRENGVRFEIRFGEGYSVGLFLDQRDNRRRLRVNHIAAGFAGCAGGMAGAAVLNTFAYTCGFSVCAALAGARTTSVDLSRKCLDWGRRNFVANGLEPAAEEFLHGEVFDWLGRLGRRRRQFDVVLLDPPTFSRSKGHGVFRAQKDYPALVSAAVPLVKSNGLLFTSTNAADFTPEDFLQQVREAVRRGGRRILQEHYCPQPPDYPVARSEPAHLKTAWLRLGS